MIVWSILGVEDMVCVDDIVCVDDMRVWSG